jgi:hypothetical protein
MNPAIPDYVTSARENAQNLGGALTGFAEHGATIQDELKQVLNDATSEGKKAWADVRGKALSDYLASPDEAYQTFRNPSSPNYIFDPIKANQVVSQHIQGSEIPFFSANTLFGMMTKQEPEMIDAGTRAFQAKANAAQTAYNAAHQIYSDILNEFNTSEAGRRADEQLALEREKVNKSGQGSASENEVKQIIKNAGQLPEDQRKAYIIDQGYNPSSTSFTGLFTAPVDWSKAADQSKVFEGAGVQYNIDPKTGTVTPREDPRYGTAKFWPNDFLGLSPFGKYEDKYQKAQPKK